MEQRQAALEVEGLQTGWGDLTVVWDLSFTVAPGEVCALLGRNGAGKTTAVRAISGLNRATGGSVRLAGEDVTRRAAHVRVREGLGHVQEGKRVFHRQSVEQNLIIGGYASRLGRRSVATRRDEIYDLFPILSERRSVLAGAMSGGQQQMLAIGQALMASPDVLILDEPSAGLAPAITHEVFAHVARLKEVGLAVVLVEQAVEATLEIADTVVVLDVGRVTLAGAVGEIGGAAALREAYFGLSGST